MSPTRPRRRVTSLASRLLLPLLLVVGGVMGAFAGWALMQRERTLVAEARRETEAYATALGLALSSAFRDPDRTEVPAIVERISRQPSIYGVMVYDLEGRVLAGPGAAANLPLERTIPDQVRRVLGSGEETEFERAQDDVDVFSVLRPVLDAEGRVVGAFEVLQPLSFVDEDKARTRVRFFLNTAVLFAAMTGVLLWLVRRLVSEPLDRFSQSVRVWGTGRLDHRLDLGSTVGELETAAEELNRMAAGLERARDELVRNAEERVSLEHRMRQTEKMAMVGRLAAGLAHEIGAPLHVIRGRADLLMQRSERPRAEARDLRIIIEQIDRITRIVRTLLGFAGPREPQLEPVDVVEVLDTVLELVSVEAGATAVRVERCGLGSLLVRGDRDQLQQVFLNLMINALQALSDVDEADRRVVVEAVVETGPEDEPVAVVRVTDSGPGIPTDHQSRIFEPFFTTKLERSGTGLGLAVASWVAEDHGGSVSFREGAEGGATFVVRLPLDGRDRV